MDLGEVEKEIEFVPKKAPQSVPAEPAVKPEPVAVP